MTAAVSEGFPFYLLPQEEVVQDGMTFYLIIWHPLFPTFSKIRTIWQML